MKDEGQFLLEWVAYHRSIGFDLVFVVTNDCSDGTDAMLDRLAEIDDVIHVRNPREGGEAPQIAGMRAALAHPAMRDVEWLLHCDADEFLNITAGRGEVDDLLDAVGECDAVALCWRPMGSGGLKEWPGGLVTEKLTRTAKVIAPSFVMHKTMFRPDRFARAIDHMPKDPLGDVVLRNTAGELLPTAALYSHHARYRGIEDRHFTWVNADIHHYAVRAEDVFLLKNVRGDGMAVDSNKYFVNSRFWRRVERNRGEDTSIQRRGPGMRVVLDRYLADGILAKLNEAAFAWFDAMRRQHVTEQNRRRWIVDPAPAEIKHSPK